MIHRQFPPWSGISRFCPARVDPDHEQFGRRGFDSPILLLPASCFLLLAPCFLLRFAPKRVLPHGRLWITLWIMIHSEVFMKTIQMTIDEPLLNVVDRVTQDLKQGLLRSFWPKYHRCSPRSRRERREKPNQCLVSSSVEPTSNFLKLCRDFLVSLYFLCVL